MNKKIIFSLLFLLLIVVSGCSQQTNRQATSQIKINEQSKEATENKTTAEAPVKENELCSWVYKSDIIIKVNISEGIIRDTSYQVGFYFGPINFNARLARKDCDYRVGFSYNELKGKGAAQVGVRGYTDSRRRQIENEPINIIFDKDGKPDIGPHIEVTIKD